MAIYVHVQEWLTLMSKVSRSTLPNAKNKQRKQQQITTTKRKKTYDTQHRPLLEVNKRRRARGGGWIWGEAMD